MDRTSSKIRGRLERLDSVSLCDASPLVRAMAPGLTPACPEILMAGQAYTVQCINDYLAVIKALSEAAEGDVLIVDGGRQSQAIFGEFLAAEAKRRGLAGAVIDGAIHHVDGIREIKFPVYYRWTNPRAGRAAVIEPPTNLVSVAGVTVERGDWVFGDADGIVVIPPSQVEEIIAVAEEIKKVDDKVFQSVRKGAALTEIMEFEEFRRAHDKEIRMQIDSSIKKAPRGPSR